MNQKLLIYQIKKGNKQALEELIHHFYPDVYRYIYLKLTIKEDAKDLCQEVFLRFIRQIPMYHDKGKLINYLYTIAYSVCMDYFRTQQSLADFDNYANQLAHPPPPHAPLSRHTPRASPSLPGSS